MRPPPLANVLPRDAAKLLQRAAQTPLIPDAPEPDLLRRIAIDKAIQQVKRMYPKLFKEQQHESET